MPIDRDQLAKRVRELREARGVTQRGLASTAHVAPGTLRSLESGERLPRTASLAAIAAALGLTRDELVHGPPPPEPAKTIAAFLQDREAISPATTQGSAARGALLKALNDEDLLVARAYQRSETAIRQQVQQLLMQAQQTAAEKGITSLDRISATVRQVQKYIELLTSTSSTADPIVWQPEDTDFLALVPMILTRLRTLEPALRRQMIDTFLTLLEAPRVPTVRPSSQLFANGGE